jgi:hypothetical protein
MQGRKTGQRRALRGVAGGFRRYLEHYLTVFGPDDRLSAAARRILALPEGATPSFAYDRDLEALYGNWKFEHDLEAADRPISERLGTSPRRLSSRFMWRLEEARAKYDRTERLALRARAGWGPASDDKIVQFVRAGECGPGSGSQRESLQEEKAKVRALALLLDYADDPFDYAGDPPPRF